MADFKLAQLNDHFRCLISNKVTVRRRAADNLKRFLEFDEALPEKLEDSQEFAAGTDGFSWGFIIQSLFNYLIEEADSLEKEEKEKRSAFVQHKSSAQRIIHLVVRLINKNENSVPYITLLKNIFVSFERPLLKRYFGDTLLKVLESAILCKSSILGNISEKYWLNILQVIKEYEENDAGSIYMVIKWAPLHKMSAMVLREELGYIQTLCNSVSSEMTRTNQENIIKLVLQFTEFTSPDSRLTCCKMSEASFVPLINIYDKSHDVNVQKDLHRLFYIQIILHHARGASAAPSITDQSYSPQSLTCAFSWHEWTRCLHTLHLKVRQRFESECRKQLIHQRRGRKFEHEMGTGEHGLIEATLLKLLVEITKQIFSDDNVSADVSQNSEIDLDCNVSSSKRARVDRSLSATIDRIRISNSSSDDLPWIAMLDQFLRRNPTAISRDDFETLVIKLSKMQLLENIATNYISSCLITLVNVEKYLYSSENISDNEDQVQEAWKRIWESALRLVGLKIYPDSTHRLLSKLLKSKKCSSHIDLLKLYFDNVIFASNESIRTLIVLCKYYPMQDTNFSSQNCIRKKLINWILSGGKSSSILIQPNLADFLVKITLRQWPIEEKKSRNFKDATSCFDYFEEIENIYELNSFTKLMEISREMTRTNISSKDNNYLCINEILEELYEVLLQISSENDSTENDITNIANLAILLLNILSNLVKYNAVDESQLSENILNEQIVKLFQKLIFHFDSTIRRIKYSNIRSLKPLFQLELIKPMQRFFKHNIPLSLLTAICKITKTEAKDSCDLQLAALEIFASYAFWNILETDNQKYAAETIFKLDLDIKCGQHYEMMKVILSLVTTCQIGQLTNDYLAGFLKIIQSITDAKYSEYETACFILNILHDILPHFAASDSDILRKGAIKILYEFFSNCKNYGPKVSMLVIQCVKQLWRLDPLSAWSIWNNVKEESKIILNLPIFLINDYVIVRYIAIECLTVIFKNTEEFNYEIFNVQQELFDGIIKRSADVFSIEANLSQEQILDETATRTATVLHTFASIIIFSPNWRKRILAEFLKLLYERKLFSSFTEKLFTLIAQKLGHQTHTEFFKKYESYLILQWDNMKLSIFDFPYALFDYEDLSDLLVKNINITYPLMMQRHYGQLLQKVCGRMCKSIDGLSRVVYPYLRSYLLMIQCNNSTTSTASNTQRFELVKASLANLNPSELDAVHIEPILLNLLDSILDLEHLKETYNLELKLPKPEQSFITVSDFKLALDVLNESLGESSLILYLFRHSPEKIQNILLTLKCNVYAVDNINERIVKFQSYSIFSGFVANSLNTPQAKKMQEYLVRDFIYTHLNFMDVQKSAFQTFCIRNFAIILNELLPACSLQIHEHVSTIVNKCVQLISDDGNHPCLSILDILILNHPADLYEALLNIDPFPNNGHFHKYSANNRNANLTVEEAIGRFLSGGSGNVWHANEYRVEGIKSLRKSLASNKNELFKFYDSLLNTRGFSEDCNQSLIHRLLCALIKYSSSNDANTSLEATRCLGELGARDLTTIILTSQCCDSSNGSSYKHLIHCVISLLIQYQIDEQIEVIIETNQALTHVLEAVDIIDTNFNYHYGKIRKEYLAPYVKKKGRKCIEPNLDAKAYFDNLSKDLWCPTGAAIKHETWAKKLVVALLRCFTNDTCLRQLISLVRLKLSFAEQILSVVINLIVTSNNPEISLDINKNINKFFDRHAKLNKNQKTSSNFEEVAMQKESLKCMLGVVHFLRLEKMNKRKNSADFTFNYLEIALAAQYCASYFTAILYAELWCYEIKSELKETQGKSLDVTNKSREQKMTVFEQVYNAALEDQKRILETVFLESYTALGETDAVACFNLTFMHNRSRDDVYKIYLQEESCSSDGNHLWYSIEDTIDFDAIYKLGNWDIEDSKTSQFAKKYIAALKAFSDDNKLGFLAEITSSRQLVIEALKQISLESTKNIYDYLAILQSINELEEIANASSIRAQVDLISKWQKEGLQNLHEFKYMEQIQLQRLMISSVLLKRDNNLTRSSITNLHLDLAQMTRERGLTKQTVNILRKLKCLPSLAREDLTRIQFEDVQLFWLKDKEIGSTLMQDFLKNHSDNKILYSLGLKLYGTWICEMGALDTPSIIKEYFQKSIQVLNNEVESNETTKLIIEAHDVLARFADEEYQRIYTYTKSSNFEIKKKVMQKLKASAKALKNWKTKAEKTAMIIFDKQSEIDESEIRHTQEQMNNFLILSMKCYIKNLVRCDKYNMCIFRIVSMWLENKSNSVLTEKTKNWLSAVSTYKYLCILPQLIPHIDSVDDFKTEILSILERCALGHPHHTLSLILSMTNANKDDQYKDDQDTTKSTKTSSSRSSSTSKSNLSISNDPRVEAAYNLLNKLKKQDKLKEVIRKMVILSDAIIDLAYIPTNKDGKPMKVNLPYQSSIRKIINFDEVALPTVTIPVRVNKEYNNIVGIHSFGNEYYTVGGINQPKKISMRGTDGIIRQTLVKGKDDMRQDAVMQQVFNIMNDLFRSNKDTSKLVVRTYKVVPLSKRSGILEWVENAKALSMYLINTHEIYSSISLNSCRIKYGKVASKPIGEKLRTFNEICQQLTPVFHRFFVNTFLESARWYERRRAYITSVAVSSMCGYVLGVGDRHVTNILIDEKTAEVIHIDFGIAFEQGRILPSPETVPFRLTREIVDGMGVTGTAGIFRKSCEKTLSVLRVNMETIIAILEVLLYDPLYVWTITPEQAYNKQLQEGFNEALPLLDMNDNSVNVSAERVLLRIRDKLTGENDKKLEGQVLKLINQARDPANLCRLFSGWQPYL